MYMKKRFFGICLCLLSLTCSVCTAQVIEPRTLTMQDVVRLAQENSISAMSNRNVFASAYWRFRNL
jgi:hypothetical protein